MHIRAFASRSGRITRAVAGCMLFLTACTPEPPPAVPTPVSPAQVLYAMGDSADGFLYIADTADLARIGGVTDVFNEYTLKPGAGPMALYLRLSGDTPVTALAAHAENPLLLAPGQEALPLTAGTPLDGWAITGSDATWVRALADQATRPPAARWPFEGVNEGAWLLRMPSTLLTTSLQQAARSVSLHTGDQVIASLGLDDLQSMTPVLGTLDIEAEALTGVFVWNPDPDLIEAVPQAGHLPLPEPGVRASLTLRLSAEVRLRLADMAASAATLTRDPDTEAWADELMALIDGELHLALPAPGTLLIEVGCSDPGQALETLLDGLPHSIELEPAEISPRRIHLLDISTLPVALASADDRLLASVGQNAERALVDALLASGAPLSEGIEAQGIWCRPILTAQDAGLPWAPLVAAIDAALPATMTSLAWSVQREGNVYVTTLHAAIPSGERVSQ